MAGSIVDNLRLIRLKVNLRESEDKPGLVGDSGFFFGAEKKLFNRNCDYHQHLFVRGKRYSILPLNFFLLFPSLFFLLTFFLLPFFPSFFFLRISLPFCLISSRLLHRQTLKTKDPYL